MRYLPSTFGGTLTGIEEVSDLTLKGVNEVEERKNALEIRMSRNRENRGCCWSLYVDIEVTENDKSIWLKKILNKDLKLLLNDNSDQEIC